MLDKQESWENGHSVQNYRCLLLETIYSFSYHECQLTMAYMKDKLQIQHFYWMNLFGDSMSKSEQMILSDFWYIKFENALLKKIYICISVVSFNFFEIGISCYMLKIATFWFDDFDLLKKSISKQIITYLFYMVKLLSHHRASELFHKDIYFVLCFFIWSVVTVENSRVFFELWAVSNV